jgi:hypothetical protein
MHSVNEFICQNSINGNRGLKFYGYQLSGQIDYWN